MLSNFISKEKRRTRKMEKDVIEILEKKIPFSEAIFYSEQAPFIALNCHIEPTGTTNREGEGLYQLIPDIVVREKIQEHKGSIQTKKENSWRKDIHHPIKNVTYYQTSNVSCRVQEGR